MMANSIKTVGPTVLSFPLKYAIHAFSYCSHLLNKRTKKPCLLSKQGDIFLKKDK